MNGVYIPDPGKAVRLQNLLQMYENGVLTPNPDQRPGAVALLCEAILAIRKKQLELQERLTWKPWAPDSLPDVGEWVFVRWEDEDGIEYTYEARDQRDQAENWIGATHWLRVPPV